MSRQEKLDPNFSKLDTALRSIGYSFEIAVADVIDNSIDADADTVLVRIVTKVDGGLDVVILDNGHGMSAHTLREAMRFGADVSSDMDRLGKFGLGLKLASLSQAKALHVVTKKEGQISGRAWLEEGVASGFSSTVYDSAECAKQIKAAIPDHRFRNGTLVIWSNLFRTPAHGSADARAQKLMQRLQAHLALAFHRFLAGRPREVSITIDIFEQRSSRPGVPISLDPLDPFGYEYSGHNGFPAELHLLGKYADKCRVNAHVWPPNSTQPAYRLPGGATTRQGFYFYRNNRLIQGGGWNGLREVEPHSSLARVEVDLSPSIDLEISLDVKKVEVQVPPDLMAAIQKATTTAGHTFKKYASLADDAYRKRKPTDAELPLIPSKGLPASLSTFLHEELRLNSTSKHRDLHFIWANLPSDVFFEMDRDQAALYLNRTYRKQLSHGRAGSAADLPVVKCLLFLVLEDALRAERTSTKSRDRIDLINRIIVEAIGHERQST